MNRTLMLLAILLVALNSALAQDTNLNTGVKPQPGTVDFKVKPGMINFQGVNTHEVLVIYQKLSGLELVVDSRAKSVSSTIVLHTSSTLTKSEAAKLIERAL